MLDRSPTLRRPLLTMLAATTAVAIGGCGSTTTSPSAPSSQASDAPAVETSAAPSSFAPRTIPATAFLQLPETMRRDHKKADGSAAVPRLCDGELAAGAGVVASAAMMNTYQQPDAPAGSVPHGLLYQTIRSYDGDEAHAFMQRARDGLADCKTYKSNENTITVRTKQLSGAADEALTIDLVQPQLDLPGNPTGGEQTNRIVVMRFGTVVTILFDDEYERSSSDPKLVDTFVQEAEKAIHTWRG
ncbi:hypothetical protein Ade02nite_63530 [Paractinoplanes deccanensis]|uniref:PknH-like extracellular domain-containing protein n=1 Tax=Paractinoplanes deccanensis TaxID=113561 RepID=A0ABQ3YCK1_9ACTN|nr:hypothetical protein [Actinoplanes deccanensis]GID77712.1 hypothetical protein Ade02nite_63530 [Actinoplanes deccanensis]